MKTIEQSTATKILKGFVIPPKPDALLKFQEEKSRSHPNIRRLADLVSTDPGMSASVIKAVNTPFFGLRRSVASVQEAATLMGVKNLDNVITSLARITSIGNPVSMERFWDTAMNVAQICKGLAKYIDGLSEDEAYMFGMFHDCGIALMIQRIPDYKQLLLRANTDTERSLLELEQERYNTDHVTIGYLVGKSWNIPEHLCTAIQLHHDRDLFAGKKVNDERILGLIAILKLASHISHQIRYLEVADDWEIMRTDVLDYLGISNDEFDEIEAEARDNSTATPQSWITKFGSV